MFGKWSCARATVAAACLAVGCAQPRYEARQPLNANGNMGPSTREEKPSECPLRFSTSKYCLAWKWEEVPTSSKVGTLIFKVYRSNVYDGSAVQVDFATPPALVLWMPSMGHGSSPTTVTRLDVGTFRASSVFFVMPGRWQMRFQVKEGTTIQDEAVVDLAL